MPVTAQIVAFECPSCGIAFHDKKSRPQKSCNACLAAGRKPSRKTTTVAKIVEPEPVTISIPSPVQKKAKQVASTALATAKDINWWKRLTLSSEEKDDMAFASLTDAQKWRSAERIYFAELKKNSKRRSKNFAIVSDIVLAGAASVQVINYFMSNLVVHNTGDQIGLWVNGIAGIAFELIKVICVLAADRLIARIATTENDYTRTQTEVVDGVAKEAKVVVKSGLRTKLIWFLIFVGIAWTLMSFFSVYFQNAFLAGAGVDATSALVRAIALGCAGDIAVAICLSIPPKSEIEIAQQVARRYRGVAIIGKELVGQELEYNNFVNARNQDV